MSAIFVRDRCGCIHTRIYTCARTRTQCIYLGDFRTLLLGMNRVQQAALPFAKFMDSLAEFDSIAGSLDQRVFNAFNELNLLSPAARQLAQEVAEKRHKRRAAESDTESVVPPDTTNRAGACQCRKSVGRKSQVCAVRCPCERDGQQCSSQCLCGEDCINY